MPNPRLTVEQLDTARAILGEVRERISVASGGDPTLRFALRRKIQKELMHDERGTPAHRNKIKAIKRSEQRNLCPLCEEMLPEKGAVLDRFEAVAGYTVENSRLIHQHCDLKVQAARGYA
jgi:hypothetical protein